MNSQRPYFPFDEIEVPSISYASFVESTACDWNLKMTNEGCSDPNLLINIFYAKVEWQSVKFDVVKETSQNGYSDVFVDGTRVDPILSFITWTDEYNLWYFYKFIYGTKNILLQNGTSSFLVKDIEIQDVIDLEGVHKLTVSFKSVRDNLNYHGAFGLNGCCNPLYLEVPAEDCDENSGGVDNNVPPCDEVVFNISESSNSLLANVSGTPSTYTVAWYWRPSETSAWQLIINNASSVSLNLYGIYRAVMTAQQCGQYIDQYLYQNPCNNFDVRIRRSNNYGLIAESDGATIFVWEFNDGTGWVTLPDTTAAITANQTGDYRVTASNDECEDQDTYYILVNELDDCDFDLSITKSGNTATAVTDALSPIYLWTRENEIGQINVGSTSTVEMTQTGIYWLIVSSGDCVKRTYTFYKTSDDCLKVEICNLDEINVTPNITVNACCDETDCNANITIICVNKVLIASGMPGTSIILWSGPERYSHSGNGAAVTVGGEYTANIIDGDCEWTESYVFVEANAGEPINDEIVI